MADTNNQLRTLKEILEIVKNKVDKMDAIQTVSYEQIRTIKEQQSVINEKLDEQAKRLEDPETGLERINDKLDANTESVTNIEQTIKVYGDMYKMNNDNAKKLEKRVEKLEEKANIEPPPELTLAEVS